MTEINSIVISCCSLNFQHFLDDGCTKECQKESDYCGDGIVQQPEQCDNGEYNVNNPNGIFIVILKYFKSMDAQVLVYCSLKNVEMEIFFRMKIVMTGILRTTMVAPIIAQMNIVGTAQCKQTRSAMMQTRLQVNYNYNNKYYQGMVAMIVYLVTYVEMEKLNQVNSVTTGTN